MSAMRNASAVLERKVMSAEDAAALLRSGAKQTGQITNNCSHPACRPLLQDYVAQAESVANGLHGSHDLVQYPSWRLRFPRTGTMKNRARTVACVCPSTDRYPDLCLFRLW